MNNGATVDRINNVLSGTKQHATLFADCFDVFPLIPDHSVDMILADLPYGTTQSAWDSVLPLKPLWAEYNRVLKPGGALVLTAAQPFTSILVCSNLEQFKYEWIWCKNRGFGHLNAKKQPMRSHESVLVFCSTELVYNPIMRSGKPYTTKNGGRSTTNKGIYGAVKDEGVLTINNGERYPITTIPFTVLTRTIHPNQKPEALFEYMIRTYTDEGMVVLDNTAGVFTTTIAAINTDRRSICIEKDPQYYRLGTERIRQYLIERASDEGALKTA